MNKLAFGKTMKTMRKHIDVNLGPNECKSTK